MRLLRWGWGAVECLECENIQKTYKKTYKKRTKKHTKKQKRCKTIKMVGGVGHLQIPKFML